MDISSLLAVLYVTALLRMVVYVHVGISRRVRGRPTGIADWLSVSYRAGEGAVMTITTGICLALGMELLTGILTEGDGIYALKILVWKLEVASNLLLLVLLVWVCCTDGNSLIRGD